jgi:hypothetical protein
MGKYNDMAIPVRKNPEGTPHYCVAGALSGIMLGLASAVRIGRRNVLACSLRGIRYDPIQNDAGGDFVRFIFEHFRKRSKNTCRAVGKSIFSVCFFIVMDACAAFLLPGIKSLLPGSNLGMSLFSLAGYFKFHASCGNPAGCI